MLDIMPKTTFILVTVLFGVICGNRLMDNRLLRSSATSYASPYKTINSDVNLNTLDGKMQDNVKLKSIEKSSKPIDLPCGTDWIYDRNLVTHNCDDNLINLLKPSSSNYVSYDNNDDVTHSNNDFKLYQNIDEFDDVFDVEPSSINTINSKNTKLLHSKLNIFPVANYKDFYDDLLVETTKEEMSKRSGNSLASVLGSPPPRGCDCKIRNDLVDLGQQHFPRYLLNAICHSERSHNDLGPKCWSGSVCRPLEYKVKVLTFRTLMDNMQKDPTIAGLPDDLRQIWKFKTVTVTAGCFCS